MLLTKVNYIGRISKTHAREVHARDWSSLTETSGAADSATLLLAQQPVLLSDGDSPKTSCQIDFLQERKLTDKVSSLCVCIGPFAF